MTTNSAPNIKKIIFYGVAIIVIFIGGFMLWATLAPLESAAIAPGTVVVAGSRRVIQHFEGGIVKEIYVKEGTRVNKAQLLMKIEDTQAKASSQINQNELWQLLGAESRISAELNHAQDIEFPEEIRAAHTPIAMEVIQLQRALFIANQNTFNSSINIYKQRIEQLEEEINGSEAQVKANQEQLHYIQKELGDIEILAEKKLIKQSRLLALKREAAGLTGKQGELLAKIAELKQKIGETNLQIIAMTEKQRKDLLDELHDTQKKLSEVLERKKTSRDILLRTEIRAPITGTVVNLKIHTIGGVVKPGEVIMDIVPIHENLIIEAKLSPLNIDVVHKGLKAKVILSGLSQRNTPKLLGEVTHVSADALLDPYTNKTYFGVHVVISAKELKKLDHQTLYPGMPAEVMIITRTATPWEYFTTPIVKSFNRAFREK